MTTLPTGADIDNGDLTIRDVRLQEVDADAEFGGSFSKLEHGRGQLARGSKV